MISVAKSSDVGVPFLLICSSPWLSNTSPVNGDSTPRAKSSIAFSAGKISLPDVTGKCIILFSTIAFPQLDPASEQRTLKEAPGIRSITKRLGEVTIPAASSTVLAPATSLRNGSIGQAVIAQDLSLLKEVTRLNGVICRSPAIDLIIVSQKKMSTSFMSSSLPLLCVPTTSRGFGEKFSLEKFLCTIWEDVRTYLTSSIDPKEKAELIVAIAHFKKEAKQ